SPRPSNRLLQGYLPRDCPLDARMPSDRLTRIWLVDGLFRRFLGLRSSLFEVLYDALRKQLVDRLFARPLARVLARSTQRSLLSRGDEPRGFGRAVREQRPVPRLLGTFALAGRRRVPEMRIEECVADQDAQAVRLQFVPQAVLCDGRHDLP